MTLKAGVPIRVPLKIDKDGNIYFDRSVTWVEYFRTVEKDLEMLDELEALQLYGSLNEDANSSHMEVLQSFIQSAIRQELEAIQSNPILSKSDDDQYSMVPQAIAEQEQCSPIPVKIEDDKPQYTIVPMDIVVRLQELETENSFSPERTPAFTVRQVAAADYGWSGSAPTSHPVFKNIGELLISANTNAGDANQYLWATDGANVYGFRATWSLPY